MAGSSIATCCMANHPHYHTYDHFSIIFPAKTKLDIYKRWSCPNFGSTTNPANNTKVYKLFYQSLSVVLLILHDTNNFFEF